jgi:hypothetical protein
MRRASQNIFSSRGLAAHRVLLGLLPLLIDLRVLTGEHLRDRIGFLQWIMDSELVIRFGHVPPDSGSTGLGMQPRAWRWSAMHGRVSL